MSRKLALFYGFNVKKKNRMGAIAHEIVKATGSCVDLAKTNSRSDAISRANAPKSEGALAPETKSTGSLTYQHIIDRTVAGESQATTATVSIPTRRPKTNEIHSKHEVSSHQSKKLGSSSYKTEFALLEARLDILLVRAQFSQTLANAKQLIRHGKVRINGQKVTICSYLVSPGQYVSLSRSDSATKAASTSSRELILKKPPSHLEINWKTFSFVMLYEPKRVIFA